VQTRVTRVVYPRTDLAQFDEWLASIPPGSYTSAQWPAIEALAQSSIPNDGWLLRASRESR
jgi:hypothetical protein